MQAEPAAAPSLSTVLVVEDEPAMRDILCEFLRDEGHHMLATGDGDEALALLREQAVDLVLLDLSLEGSRLTGMEVARQAVSQQPGVPIIVISGTATVESAVEAMHLGVFDFLVKTMDTRRLRPIIRNALERGRLQHQRDHLLAEVRERYRMIGTSPAMRRVYELIDRVAEAPSHVLVTGETGTGKEAVARAIHYNSARRLEPFVPINCGAVPSDLLESTLFGHKKGAFTGAVADEKGLVEAARGGTMLLDEIGDMPPALQVKLLRVIDAGEYLRVGEAAVRTCDVRWIAATRRDLAAAVEDGTFRLDLLHRLNVLHLHVPSLREHPEDIPALVHHFLGVFSKELHCAPKRITSGGLHVLARHDWPGNVRELRNIVERLVVLNRGEETLHARHVAQALNMTLASEGLSSTKWLPLEEAVSEFERDYVLSALQAHGWKRELTADTLGINRVRLWRLMDHYQLKAPTAQSHG